MKFRSQERGAAAVEFALVVPVLLILVLGIIEFGRAYNIQTTLSSAAREGVRVMALQSDVAAAKTATRNGALPAVVLTDSQISVSPATAVGCKVPSASTTATATVTVTYPMTFMTTFFGTNMTLTGKGVMRCNG